MRTYPLTAVFLLCAAPALAGDWFQHEYGELRSRHGDWLAVCADRGAGQCRVVQTFKDPASDAFFDARLALTRNEPGPGWTLIVMDRGLNNTEVTTVSAAVDSKDIRIADVEWTASRGPEDNAIDELFITGAEITGHLLAMMRAGARVTFTYAPAGEGDGSATFSLRGVTAATDAVNARVQERQKQAPAP